MSSIYALDRNEYILRRLFLLRELDTPKISDAKKNLGEDLAEKVFCNCHESLKETFGLEPPLKGVIGKELWSSPSDLLIGKVCLKPPLTTKHVKALTHQSILEIGLKIERLFWNQVEIEKSREIEEQDIMFRLTCEASKKEAVANAQKKMMEIFQRQRLELINEMDDLCKDQMRRMELKFQRDLQDELREQARLLGSQYQIKIEEEVSRTSEIITEKSNTDLEEIEKQMQKAIQMQIQKAEIQAQFEKQKQTAKCKEKLNKLHHELQCRNLANLMFMICMEREKCQKEKIEAENLLTQEIKELIEHSRSKDEEIEKIKANMETLKKDVEIREKSLRDLIAEFQKFINFALKSAPKQAEYLLCPEKLLVFELAENLMKLEVPQDADDDHERNYLWTRDPPKPETPKDSLKVKDGHDCLREPERSDSELSDGHFLPGFFYNDQLFVREDFRNMLSQNISINENNMLWSKHVQEISDLAKAPCVSCIFNENKASGTNRLPMEHRKSLLSYQSSVHFSMKDNKDKSTVSLSDKEKKIRKISLKNVSAENVIQTIDFKGIGSEEKRKTLLSARNSLEIIKDVFVRKRSIVKSEDMSFDISEEKSLQKPNFMLENLSEEVIPGSENAYNGSRVLLEAKDSLIKTVTKYISSTTDILKPRKKDEVPVRQKSLVKCTDSIEIIKKRESIQSEKLKKESKEDSHSDECALPDCNVMVYKRKLVEIEESKEPEKEEKVEETSPLQSHSDHVPRRVSITFSGKSAVIGSGHEEKKQPTQKKKIQKNYRPKKMSTVGNSRRVRAQKEPEKRAVVEKDQVEQFSVVGDPKFKFDDQNEQQFSTDRVHSMVKLLRENPNLIRLFTSVTR